MAKDRAREMAERIAKERGFSRPWHGLLAARDPEFLENYHKHVMHVFRGRALPGKYKEIIAVCVAAVNRYEDGLRLHLRNALKAGATEDEVVEALEVCTMESIHNLSIFLPAVVEEVNRFREGQR